MKKLSLLLAVVLALFTVPALSVGITNLWTTNNGGVVITACLAPQ